MKKQTVGLTLVASAMLASFVFIPSADAQVTAAGEAQARINAQRAAEGEAVFGEQMGIPRAWNQASIQKKYNDTYNSQMQALGMQGSVVTPSYGVTYGTPYVAPLTTYPYGYNVPNRRFSTAGRILNRLF